MSSPVSVDWHEKLSDADQQRIRDLIVEAKMLDGVAPVGDQVLRELGQDRTRHLLAATDGDIRGYLNLTPAGDDAPPMAELVGAFKKRGVWPFTHFNRIHLAPPLVTSDDDLSHAMGVLDEVLDLADRHVVSSPKR